MQLFFRSKFILMAILLHSFCIELRRAFSKRSFFLWVLEFMKTKISKNLFYFFIIIFLNICFKFFFNIFFWKKCFWNFFLKNLFYFFFILKIFFWKKIFIFFFNSFYKSFWTIFWQFFWKNIFEILLNFQNLDGYVSTKSRVH